MLSRRPVVKVFSSRRPLEIFSAVLLAGITALFIIAQASLPAKATDFSHIYAFGDSLVDTGNAFAKTGIPPAPYFEGRFSNGPIWIDYIAGDMSVMETNLAYGGARSDDSGELQIGNSPAIPVPGLLAQVNAFVASSAQIDEKALYIIWVGANDYLSGAQSQPSATVGNISTAVSTLNMAGAEHFLIANLPELGELPLIRDGGQGGGQMDAIAALNALSVEHNNALAEAVAGLNRSDNLTIHLLDTYALFKSAVEGGLGLSDITDACTRVSDCINSPTVQSSYLFWDEVHPTTATHRIIADRAIDLVENNVS